MIILVWSVYMCMHVCMCVYVCVFLTLKQEPTSRGPDVFHNTHVSFVFLWINFPCVCVVSDCTASLIWPHVSTCNITYSRSLGGKRIGAGPVSSGSSFHGLAAAPRTVAQCPWGRLGKTPQSQGLLLQSRRPKRPLPLHCQVPGSFTVIVISTIY